MASRRWAAGLTGAALSSMCLAPTLGLAGVIPEATKSALVGGVVVIGTLFAIELASAIFSRREACAVHPWGVEIGYWPRKRQIPWSDITAVGQVQPGAVWSPLLALVHFDTESGVLVVAGDRRVDALRAAFRVVKGSARPPASPPERNEIAPAGSDAVILQSPSPGWLVVATSVAAVVAAAALALAVGWPVRPDGIDLLLLMLPSLGPYLYLAATQAGYAVCATRDRIVVGSDEGQRRDGTAIAFAKTPWGPPVACAQSLGTDDTAMVLAVRPERARRLPFWAGGNPPPGLSVTVIHTRLGPWAHALMLAPPPLLLTIAFAACVRSMVLHALSTDLPPAGPDAPMACRLLTVLPSLAVAAAGAAMLARPAARGRRCAERSR